MYLEKIKEKIEKYSFIEQNEIYPCEKKEVEALKNQLECNFPKPLEEFLLWGGKGIGNLINEKITHPELEEFYWACGVPFYGPLLKHNNSIDNRTIRYHSNNEEEIIIDGSENIIFTNDWNNDCYEFIKANEGDNPIALCVFEELAGGKIISPEYKTSFPGIVLQPKAILSEYIEKKLKCLFRIIYSSKLLKNGKFDGRFTIGSNCLDLGFERGVTISEANNAIKLLKSIEEISFNSHEFGELPDSITDLKELEIIFSSGNNLSEFPEQILQIKNLQDLFLQKNQISSIPNQIKELERLEFLNLSENKLKSINELTSLKNLKYLDLKDCLIEELPEKINDWKNLEIIKLSGNNFSNLPQSILELENIQVIDVRNCPNLNVSALKYLKKQFPNKTIYHEEIDYYDSYR
jgi:hypothetical protein